MAEEIRHFTASGLVVTPDRRKVLLLLHKKLQAWLQPGGHMESNELPHLAALREVLEETGLNPEIKHHGIELGLEANEEAGPEKQLPSPYIILEEDIPAFKTQRAHKHIDMIYLMEHEEKALQIDYSEAHAYLWVSRHELLHLKIFPGLRKLLFKTLH